MPEADDTMLRELEAVIAGILGTRMRDTSKWSVRTGAAAAATEGIAGTIVIKIPARKKDLTDVTFHSGTVDLVVKWAS